MKSFYLKFIRLFIGYFICAVGMVMTINAQLGALPWDVLHQGIGNVTGLTVGKANIIVGFIIIVLDILFGEDIGWGTVFNMIFIGVFMDILMINELIPIFNNFLPSFIMMLLGLLILGYGVFIYIGAGFGAGPRDGLMVALTKRTNKSVRFIKNSIEILVLIVGYFLGGYVGIGTAILSIMGGYFFQFAFKTVNFNVGEVEHRFIKDDINYIKERFFIKKSSKEEL